MAKVADALLTYEQVAKTVFRATEMFDDTLNARGKQQAFKSLAQLVIDLWGQCDTAMTERAALENQHETVIQGLSEVIAELGTRLAELRVEVELIDEYDAENAKANSDFLAACSWDLDRQKMMNDRLIALQGELLATLEARDVRIADLERQRLERDEERRAERAAQQEVIEQLGNALNEESEKALDRIRRIDEYRLKVELLERENKRLSGYPALAEAQVEIIRSLKQRFAWVQFALQEPVSAWVQAGDSTPVPPPVQ